MSDERGSCRPVCLALEPEPVLAFLHLPPAGGQRTTAILICPPFGWEEMCSHRGRRVWAQELASAGYPAARFDLPGSGDSGGSPHDPDLVASWTVALGDVAGWLRQSSGASRVAALGIGLGGLIACRALASGAAIDDLILWAVPSRGRLVLRELRAHAALVAASYPEDRQAVPPLPDGVLELIGYRLDAPTTAALTSIDVASEALATVAGRRVLLLGRDGIAVDERLREHFERAEAAVSRAPGNGYSELMAHPEQTRPPLETIATTLAWLDEGDAQERASTASAAPPAIATEPRSQRARPVRDSLALSHGGVSLRETPVEFDLPTGRLFGVLTEPAEGHRVDLCAVLLNSGALRHTGPNRGWVEIARRWGARGLTTLRVDHRGIGESDDEDPRLVTIRALNAPDRTEQTLAILDQLRGRDVPRRFMLGGLCSGAYWALHTTVADPDVVAALMINLYAFRWSESLVAERERRAAAQALRGGIIERARSGRLRREHFARGLRSLKPGGLRLWGGSVEDAQTPELERMLDQLRDRNAQLLFLLTRGEPLYDQLDRQGHLAQLDRWPNVRVERIPSRDHMFRALWLQSHVHERLDAALQRILAAG